MTLEDFRLLIARISLAEPLLPAKVSVKATPSAKRRPLELRRPVRLSPVRPV